MLLLASSVCGLFKWRQFEPEVILLAVGWYFALLAFVPRRRGTPCRARTFGRPRYRLEVGAALRPGNGTQFALEAQTDKQQLAGGRNLHSGQGQVGLFITGLSTPPGQPSTSFYRPSRTRPRPAVSGQSLGKCKPSGAARY
jgi:hypothetical protein